MGGAKLLPCRLQLHFFRENWVTKLQIEKARNVILCCVYFLLIEVQYSHIVQTSHLVWSYWDFCLTHRVVVSYLNSMDSFDSATAIFSTGNELVGVFTCLVFLRMRCWIFMMFLSVHYSFYFRKRFRLIYFQQTFTLITFKHVSELIQSLEGLCYIEPCSNKLSRENSYM